MNDEAIQARRGLAAKADAQGLGIQQPKRVTSGVFSTLENAEAWIARHKLSRVLTKYPVDVGV